MEVLCKIRDLYRAISDFEFKFVENFGLCLNEGMLLCSLLENEKMSSGEIAEGLGLSTSNTSKVIKSVETKELAKRSMGSEDKRQMYFVLTPKGKAKIEAIKCSSFELPEVIKRNII